MPCLYIALFYRLWIAMAHGYYPEISPVSRVMDTSYTDGCTNVCGPYYYVPQLYRMFMTLGKFSFIANIIIPQLLHLMVACHIWVGNGNHINWMHPSPHHHGQYNTSEKEATVDMFWCDQDATVMIDASYNGMVVLMVWRGISVDFSIRCWKMVAAIFSLLSVTIYRRADTWVLTRMV